jgi:hypothetical protein
MTFYCSLCGKREYAVRCDGTVYDPVRQHPVKKKRTTGIACSSCVAVALQLGKKDLWIKFRRKLEVRKKLLV